MVCVEVSEIEVVWAVEKEGCLLMAGYPHDTGD